MPVIDLLRKNPHLARLAPEHLDALDRAFVVSQHSNGHVITRQGDHGGGVFLVVEGEVEVSHVHAGLRHALGRLGPGELFGLVSLVDQGPRSATCSVVGTAKVAALSSGAAALLFHAHAPIAYAFQRALASQLAHDFRRLDAQLRELYEYRASRA